MHGQLLVDQERRWSLFLPGNRLMQFTPKTKPESNSGGRNSPESMIHLFLPNRITLQRFWLPNWL